MKFLVLILALVSGMGVHAQNRLDKESQFTRKHIGTVSLLFTAEVGCVSPILSNGREFFNCGLFSNGAYIGHERPTAIWRSRKPDCLVMLSVQPDGSFHRPVTYPTGTIHFVRNSTDEDLMVALIGFGGFGSQTEGYLKCTKKGGDYWTIREIEDNLKGTVMFGLTPPPPARN